jgi:tetratricopeptide (TPR) repeat protein
MSRHIFLSYRRLDSEGYAGRLFDRLSARFGQRNIFMDVAAIDAGVDFSEELKDAVQGCDVLLALIGPQWLTVPDAHGKPRLQDPGDYVRLEIATALKRGIRVIPVLLQGASMPGAAALPEDLKPLAMCNAVTLTSPGFDDDMRRLVEQIEKALDDAEREEAERETSMKAQAAASAFRSLHQLPLPPADFTGRDELIAQLLEDFQKRKGAAITGLTGMGGIGKTALGLVVAHSIVNDYPDAQIFLDLKGTTTPLSAADAMRHVVLSFEPTADLRALDDAGMGNAYRTILHGKRALLFFDNARSAEQVAPLRPPETSTMLVTSRWAFGLPGLQTRRLDLMKPESAEQFLLELCPRIDGQSDELARACAYLPLALRIAGSFLQVNPDWPVKTYVAQLEDRKGRLAALHDSREGAELTTEPDLLATFEMSYQQLSEEDRKRWRTLGVFPTSFDARAAAAMWKMEEDDARRLLGLLLRYSLLDYDETSERYSLHDLLADYALSQMDSEEEGDVRLKHASHYKDVLSAADDLYTEGGENVLAGLRLFDLEWENIQAGQAWAAGAQSQEAAWLCATYPGAGAYLLELRQHPGEQIRWLQATLAAARQIGDRRGEGSTLGNLGIAYYRLGDTRKAIEYYEQHLTIAKEIGHRQGEGNALGNLGLAYYSLGEPRKAIEYHEQALAIDREIGDHRGEGAELGNLGLAYADLGDPRKAIEYHEQALAISREIGDLRGEGQDLCNLGNAYYSLGEPRKAIEYHEQALAIDREIGDRRGEGQDLGSLGTAYADLGEARKAIEYYEQHLTIAKEIGHRQGEGNALGNLGLAYYSLGEPRKAIEYDEQHLTIAKEIGHRQGEGNALGNLGLAYYSLGEPRKAIEYYEQSLAIARETGDRQGEARQNWNLGLAYEKAGELDRAIEVMQICVDFEREVGDPDAEEDAAYVEKLRKKLRRRTKRRG